ncbi:MAG: DUF3108 domain-containing protein [Aquabacterium sp.]
MPITSSRASTSGQRRHGLALGLLTLAVLLIHLWLTYAVSERMAALSPEPGIQRMEATYVSEVKLTAPPVAVAAVQPPAPTPVSAASARAPRPRKKKPVPAPKAASAPQEAASEPPVMAQETASQPVAQAPEPTPPTVTSAPSEAVAPTPPLTVSQSASSPSPSGPTFVWPKATRVNFKLEGNYRGPFYGTAAVEWVRQDNRYQVHMEASVAILGSMHMTSEGLITPKGLAPQRYESVNRMLFRSARMNSIRFEEEQVVLANGDREPRLPEMQDPVSQLIHLAYRFIQNPELLKPGNTVEMPIAWTKKTEILAYDVMKEETLSTTMGEIATLHVKPRRVIKDKDNLSGEIWFAPGLQYLPVRIFTRWSDEIWLDMKMDGAPQQSPGEAPADHAGKAATPPGPQP